MVESTRKHLTLVFLFWKVVNYWFNCFKRYGLIHIVYFFLYEFWQIVFLGTDPFYLCNQICGIDLFIVCLYYSFNVYGIVMMSSSSFLILIICVLLFFFVCQRLNKFTNLFKELALGFIDFLLLYFRYSLAPVFSFLFFGDANPMYVRSCPNITYGLFCVVHIFFFFLSMLYCMYFLFYLSSTSLIWSSV